MNSMNYIGLDIHKKSISCGVRQADGTIIQESTMVRPATRWTSGWGNCHSHGWPAWRPRCLPDGFMTIWYRAAPW
jgi:hypothetical protein